MPFFWPHADFWRPLARAFVCVALAAIACVMIHQPVHAAGRFHSAHRHAHRATSHHVTRHGFAHHRRHLLFGHHRHHGALHASRARIRAARRDAPISSGRNDDISIALRYLGAGNPTGTRGPWCGDFMNFVERLAGRSGIRSRLAQAWATYGRAGAAVRGAIAVERHHVSIVMRRVRDRLQIISGNWARHRVGIGWISMRSVIAFRTP